jgi:hypothetical protein
VKTSATSTAAVTTTAKATVEPQDKELSDLLKEIREGKDK